MLLSDDSLIRGNLVFQSVRNIQDVQLPPISPSSSSSSSSGQYNAASQQRFTRVKLVRLWSTLNNQMERGKSNKIRSPAIVYKYK